MPERIWWIWMILAAIFAIAELLTAGFFLLWFGVGAAVAGILAVFGLAPGWQWAAFVVVSAVLLAISRRFAERFTAKQPPGIGADRLVGSHGVVLEEVDNDRNTGRVRLNKEEWRAVSDAGDVIPADAHVVVVRLEGTHVVVRAAGKEQEK